MLRDLDFIHPRWFFLDLNLIRLLTIAYLPFPISNTFQHLWGEWKDSSASLLNMTASPLPTLTCVGCVLCTFSGHCYLDAIQDCAVVSIRDLCEDSPSSQLSEEGFQMQKWIYSHSLAVFIGAAEECSSWDMCLEPNSFAPRSRVQKNSMEYSVHNELDIYSSCWFWMLFWTCTWKFCIFSPWNLTIKNLETKAEGP